MFELPEDTQADNPKMIELTLLPVFVTFKDLKIYLLIING